MPVPPDDPRPETLNRPTRPTPRDHASLLALLDDPSPAVWEPVFRELRLRGTAPLVELEDAARHPNPRLRARARALVEGHHRRLRLRRLIRYVARTASGNAQGTDRFDLERALWMLSAIEAPRFDARRYRRELDDLAENARGAFHGVRGDLDRAMVLPSYVGDRYAFTVPRRSDGTTLSGDDLDRATHHPHNILLHRVLEKRRGLPLSIAVVWKLAFERLAAPIELIGIPGHVLVRIPAGKRRILVDPCASGRPVSRREVRQYLEAYDIPFGPNTFEPMSDRAILRRTIANYMRGMGLRGQIGQAEELLTLHALCDE
jgi:regulator of sirC expression with transglutaminase-like and TPR domain